MNQLKKRSVRSMAWTALLLTVTVLVLTCTMALGIAAADGDTYTLKLAATLYDENGEEWPVGIQVELAEGDVIDTDALYAKLVADYPHMSGTVLSDEGFKGLPADGKMPAGDLTVTATYEVRPYTIKWVVDGVTTEQKVAYKKLPVFDGSTDKAADAQYTYTFAGWDTEPVKATADATYTATYTRTVNEYTVTWIVDGNTTTETYKYGETPAFKGSTDKAGNAEFTYTFNGWDKAIATVEGDVTYTAVYTETVNEYTVTWIVDGSTTTETYKYGETPAFKGSTDKAADAQYTYTFAGWDKALAAVEGDATYTATYTETINEYTVTWIVDGNTTTETYKYGETPAFKGSTDKAADAQYTYTFAGWDKTLAAVEDDATYTATYTETLNKYTVTWIVDGVSTTTEVEYGKFPSFDGTPVKAPDDQYTYTFAGWTPAVVAVTGDATYTATFTSELNTVSIIFKVEGQADVTLVVKIGETPVYPNGTPSKAADAQYTYTFKGWDKTVGAATEDTVYTAVFTATLNKYTVTWVVGDKTVTEQVEYGTIPSFNGSTDKVADAQYTYTFKGWDKTLAAVEGDVTYTAQYDTTVRKYLVTFKYGHSTVLPVYVTYGQAATAPTNTDKAPTAQYTYTFEGWDVDFSNITGNLVVTAKYTEAVRSYTVTFNYGDGKTETVTVEYGKGATAPTDTDKAATEEFTYTFKGWDADFSEITADLTVNAQYDEIPVKEPETTEPDTETPTEPDTEDPTEPDTEDPTEPDTDESEDATTEPEDPTEAPTETETESETEEPVPGGCGNAWIWIVLVVVIAGAAAAVVIILLRRKNTTDPEPTEPEAEAEPEVESEPEAPAAPLFIPVGEEIPEEEIPEEVETVEEVNADTVDDMMTDKVAAAFLVASDEEGGQGKMGIINVGLISAAYQAGETVDLASLQAKGMIDGNVGRLKVLASGTLDKPLTIKADAFSVQAVKMITLTGGQAIELKGE